MNGASEEEEATRERAHLLLVEGDPFLGEALRRAISGYCGVRWVAAADDALRALCTRASWNALIVEEKFEGTDGLDIVAEARSLGLQSPALVLVEEGCTPELDRAFDLDARFVFKPSDATAIEPFADRVQRFVCRGAGSAAWLDAMAEVWCDRYHLSPAEADVLLRGAIGDSRALIALERNSSEATVKKHISNLLQKTADESFGGACARLIREVVVSARHDVPRLPRKEHRLKASR